MALVVKAFMHGAEENIIDIHYDVVDLDQAMGLRLLAFILDRFGFKYDFRNSFKMKVIPANSRNPPFILNNAKSFITQKVEKGDTIEILYHGSLQAKNDDSTDASRLDAWREFKVMDWDAFQVDSRPLSGGRDGDVYAASAKDITSSLSLVALKVIRSYDSSDVKGTERLLKELRIMKGCNHPAVMKLEGVIPPSPGHDRPVIVTRLMDGSLQDWIDKRNTLGTKTLSDAEKYLIIYGIAAGMKYLHDQHIHHRDLKPANVLLDSNMRPVITDFGFSKISDAQQSLEMSSIGGTYMYMAPEAFNRAYSVKTDVYAFAILAWAVWNQQRPFTERPFIYHLNAIRRGERPTAINRKDAMAKVIAEITERGWETLSADRPDFETILEWMKDQDVLSSMSDKDRKMFEEYISGFGEMPRSRSADPVVPSSDITDLGRRAQLEDGPAMVEMGRAYEQGIVIEQDMANAVYYYRSAAAMDNAEGYLQLGRCYLNGLGVTKDEVVGQALIEKGKEIQARSQEPGTQNS